MEADTIFIRKISINKVRHLESFDIPISDDVKKHLIITGKNGSGKTSLLRAIANYIRTHYFDNFNPDHFQSNIIGWKNAIDSYSLKLSLTTDEREKTNLTQQIASLEQNIKSYETQLLQNTEVSLDLNNRHLLNKPLAEGNFLIDVEQFARDNRQEHVEGSKTISFQKLYRPEETVSHLFAQFLTNQRMDMLNDREENDTIAYNKTREWFVEIENMFKIIFGDTELKLKYNKNRRIHELIQTGREPFGLHEMSSGYAAYFKLITELIMRMNVTGSGNYNVNGICIIDEIETHLHIDLQRQALPFLTKFFPNIQFIVTTHSPFVVNSIENSVAYDLENKILISNPTKFSGDTITELYFRSELISEQLKTRLIEYDTIASASNPTLEQLAKWKELSSYFESIFPFLNDETKTTLRAVKLKSAIPNG